MPISNKIRGIKVAIKDFLLGATVYDMIRNLEEKMLYTENMFMLAVVGDMLGYPIFTYYRLKLLPYWVFRLQAWKRHMLKEKDITERLR